MSVRECDDKSGLGEVDVHRCCTASDNSLVVRGQMLRNYFRWYLSNAGLNIAAGLSFHDDNRKSHCAESIAVIVIVGDDGKCLENNCGLGRPCCGIGMPVELPR